MPLNELADRMGVRTTTLRKFLHVSDSTPRGWNLKEREEQAIEIWQNFYKRKTFSEQFTTEPYRRGLNHIGQAIDPMIVRVNPQGRLHGKTGRVTLTDRVHDYINGLRIRGETQTYLEICEHFASKKFADYAGVSIRPITTRQAIKRVIGRAPELAPHVIKAKPGRKEGSRVIHGRTLRAQDPRIDAATPASARKG